MSYSYDENLDLTPEQDLSLLLDAMDVDSTEQRGKVAEAAARAGHHELAAILRSEEPLGRCSKCSTVGRRSRLNEGSCRRCMK